MPFKSISAPRKASSVDAELTAAAALTSPSLVVMVSTDPVRLAVQPSTGTSKIVNASLSSADEVALLGRDVALVRSGDDVWALRGLSHQPKLEQVTRDVRSLASSPSGEAALCLGWDGRGTALTLGNNEVDARSFTLRGDHRAIALGHNETWTIVESGEAGEMRIHPGLTPEPGPRDRAMLPRQARAFDRLRAGQHLGAAFKRGGQEAAIITRTQGGCSAKMVRFHDAIVDVAAIETSLFVAFEDGSVRLYDKASLAGAGESALEATFTSSSRQHGDPRTLIADRASLWIGTSTGEVLSASAIRKNAL